MPEFGGTSEQFRPQFRLARKLQEQYEMQLYRRYGVTEDIADSISVEAIDRGWPQPPLPERLLPTFP